SYLAFSSAILSSSGRGQDLEVLPLSDPAWPSSSLAVYSSRYTLLSISSSCSSLIFKISVSPSLVTLSVSVHVLASAGEGVS
nr:hypothetical protein [Tanacetum cinerariifolium]